ncbi:hypothetical protein GGX14DRAFT_399131 [Mycena pura]|uniref:DUF6535 domain-containing protein n=1 Tax=Mycena pura TaxID=153505 RepID=A0AAD6Y5Z3_9AGAR|nr:hypothetical protein GGX14DRAFT_399131 [Mycena pura]
MAGPTNQVRVRRSRSGSPLPHVAIPDMKEETGAIDSEEPAKQAPVLPEEKATLSEILSVLKNLLTSNADQSDKLHTAVEALKQKPEALDIKTAFWNAYKPLADEFDKEFKDKYGTNLDTSLIFAGLFSAVSSAFIIQIQPQLQPDPNVITQGLLLLHLVHNITGSVPPGINVPVPTGVDSRVVIAQSFLYFSLFSTLLAALLAVLAKQWLLHYDSAGERGSIEHRGLERQRKVDGLQRWKFDFVMQIFPLLLQTSLLLFAAALSIYLWTVNNVIAGISIGLTSLGVILYILMVLSAVISRDSPYQTSLTAILISIISYTATFSKSKQDLKHGDDSSSNWSSDIQHRKFWQKFKDLPPLLPRFNSEKSKSATPKPTPMFGELPPPSKEIQAVLWALETSTDPRVVEAAAVMVLSLQWPIDLELQPAMRRLADVCKSCFTSGKYSHIGIVREGMDARATSCLKAFRVLEMMSSNSEDIVNPFIFDQNFIRGGGDELTSLVQFFKISEFNPRWAQNNVTQWTLRFISGQHPQESDLEKVLDHFNPNGELLKDSSLLADFLFCINSFFSHPARHDLALMDKRNYDLNIMEKLLDNLAKHLTAVTDPLDPQIAQKIFKKIGLFKHSGLLDPNLSQWRTAAYKFCANPEQPWDVKASMMELVRIPTGYIRPVRHIAVDVAWVYTKLEELQRPLTGDSELLCDLLQTLCCVQSVPLKSTIANTLISAISPVQHDNNNTRRMQQLAFQLICSAVHWFEDNELQPVLREQLVLEKLHNALMDFFGYEYVTEYLKLFEQISNIPLWQNVMRQNRPGWLQLMYSTMAKRYPSDAFLLVSAQLWGIDEIERHEYSWQEQPLVLAFTALTNIWNQFISTDLQECHQIATIIRCTVSMASPSRAGYSPWKDGICVIQPSQDLKDKIMPRLSNALTTAAREIADNPNVAQEMKATMSCAADIMLKVASTITGELTHGWDQQHEANSEEAELWYWENLRMGFDAQLSALEELVEKMGEEHGLKTTVDPAMPVE